MLGMINSIFKENVDQNSDTNQHNKRGHDAITSVDCEYECISGKFNSIPE